MRKREVVYGKQLSQEWAEWVEKPNSKGTREVEIFPFIKEWLRENKPKSLLDIGCGQGICANLLTKECLYVGVDTSEQLIERAKKLYSDENKEFKIGDAYSLPIENNSVDAAMSIWVWSHLDDLDKAAGEMARVIKPKGKYLVITANPETYDLRKTFYKSYREKDGLLIGTFDLGNGKVLTDSTLYLHSLEKMRNGLIKAGLNIDNESRIGRNNESPQGLYVVFSGTKT